MAFKIPSVENMLEQFFFTFKRFPLSILVAVLGTVLFILSIDTDNEVLQQHQIRAALSCFIALPSLMAVKTYAEATKSTSAVKWILKVIALALLLIFYWRVDDLEGYKFPVIFLLLVLTAHLLVAFAPWIGGRREGFWQYNKQLFLKILTAFIFSGVLFAGLAIAILAVDQLFNANIEEETYLRLFLIMAGIFNTIFFLSGVPVDFEALKKEESYPKALKVFTQYILLPLVFIYLVILYAYMAKILINTEWPVGWVAVLVLCFSIAGIFSFLLIYPMRNAAENKWIKVFNRWFYIALIPLTIMLFIAIFKRLQQYGITEERYFVLLLAIWLTGIIAYFLMSKKDDIRVIPVSLFLLTLVAIFTAFPVARNSQLNRFGKILEQNGLLTDGKIMAGATAPSFEVEKELSSILDFLDDRMNMDYVQPWLSFELDSLTSSQNRFLYGRDRLARSVMSKIGFTYRSKWAGKEQEPDGLTEYAYNAPTLASFDVAGFDYLGKQYFPDAYGQGEENPYLSQNDRQEFELIFKGNHLKIDLETFAWALKRKYSSDTRFTQEEIRLDAENDVLKVRLFFEKIRFNVDAEGKMQKLSGNVWLLVKEK